MSAGAVVVNRNDGVVVLLGHRADGIVDSFLHLRIGSLYGVKFYGIVVFTRSNRGYCSATHADAVVVASHQYDVVSLGGTVLGGVSLLRVAYSSREHDHLVVAVLALGTVRIRLGMLQSLE